MKNKNERPVKNILVSRLRFMGDIILTTPLLDALKQAWPGSRITYLAETPWISLLENHPHADRLLALDKNSRRSEAGIVWRLMRQKFDLAIDLFGNPRSALLTWTSGARTRIGGNFRGRRHFYTHRITSPPHDTPAIDFHLSYLQPLKIQYKKNSPAINVTPEEKLWAIDYLQRRGFDTKGTIVGLHPGASWPAKMWFAGRFAVTANRLYQKRGVQILFTMGPGEQEIVRAVVRSCHFSVIEPRLLTIRQLAAVIQQLDVYVSNDCGPMHLGPAVGTPTVGIFGPGEPDIWFPYSTRKGHRLVLKNIDCSRCGKDFCEKMDCMKAVTVGDVYAAITEILDQREKIWQARR